MNLLKSLVKNRDRRVSIIVFIFAIVWLVMAQDIQSVFAIAGSADPGPSLFPNLIGILLIVTSIGKFITCNQEDNSKFYDSYKGWIKAFAVLALLSAYCWAFPILGYSITTFLTGILSVLLLKEDRKIRWFSVLLFSGLLTGIMYVLFVEILSVVLPVGSLWKMIGL